MLHGLRIMFLIIPPYSFLALAAISVFCCASLQLAKNICKISSQELQTTNHSLIGTCFALILVSEIAMILSTLGMLYLTSMIPSPLSRVHSEWGIAYEKTYFELAAYYVVYGLVYASLQFPSAFILRKAVSKDFIKLFTYFCALNTGMWLMANLGMEFIIP